MEVSWDTNKPINSITISTYKENGGRMISSQTFTSQEIIKKGKYTVDAFYGKSIIRVSVSDGLASSTRDTKISVSSDEYIISPFIATMPVTIFSVNMKEFTNNTIPTLVWLERGGAWNYGEMPENVHLIPAADNKSISTTKKIEEIYSESAKYVGELYELNKDAKFHFYCNDYHSSGWMFMSLINNIPTENFDVTLLSDGTASKYVLDSVYGDEDGVENLNKLTQDYNKLKTDLRNKHNYNYSSETYGAWKLSKYILCMLNDDEIDLKMYYTAYNYISAFAGPTEIKNNLTQLQTDGKLIRANLGSWLGAMSDEEKVALKKLYKFNDEVFSEATSQGKKIAMIVGTTTPGEVDFDDYVDAIRAYYGDGYVYYYKGHPGTPTQSDAAKAEKLKNMGLIDVDSTIAAELIFFFNDTILGTGYNSSTFSSLEENQVGGIWNCSFEDINTEYKEKADFGIKKVGQDDTTYGSLINNDRCYVFEFKDTTEYNIAVYNAVNKTLKYYAKNSLNQFEIVD